MLKYFDLSQYNFDNANILLHADTGGGKTHLLGDFLRTERERGDVLFCCIQGQESWPVIGNMGFERAQLVKAETYADLKGLRTQLCQKPIQALAIDSAKDVIRLIRLDVTGGVDRDLRTGDYKTNEYTTFNREVESFFLGIREGSVAKYVMVSCVSDKSSEYIVEGKARSRITPDAGSTRHSNQLGQHFDYAFFLEIDRIDAPTGPGKNPTVVRKVTTMHKDIITKARVPPGKSLPLDINIPEGGGGWAAIRGAIQSTFNKPTGGKS